MIKIIINEQNNCTTFYKALVNMVIYGDKSIEIINEGPGDCDWINLWPTDDGIQLETEIGSEDLNRTEIINKLNRLLK